ncbi:MAG: YiiX/YebB-like N1pC/P60 family cysteine hydrolase [Planctomycetota bacterium]
MTFALGACRAFPVGLYVPTPVLEALEPRGADASVAQLDAELVQRFGALPEVATEPERYWRIEGEAPRGPFAPERAEHEVAGLAAGDLVLVKNPKAQSLATTLTFARFTYYDHLGVLIERDGALFVCDSWPSFHPIGKCDDFASRFRGGVRATELGRFLAHYETLAVVRLPDERRNAALARAAQASLDEAIEYDPHHDPRDPRLSCSEYVRLLLERAGYAELPPPRAVTSRTDYRTLLQLLGFPSDAFDVPEDLALLPGARTVALVSRFDTHARLAAHRAAFERLHARFQAGARLDELLVVDRLRFLAYPPRVALFLRAAVGYEGSVALDELERCLLVNAPPR